MLTGKLHITIEEWSDLRVDIPRRSVLACLQVVMGSSADRI